MLKNEKKNSLTGNAESAITWLWEIFRNGPKAKYDRYLVYNDIQQ